MAVEHATYDRTGVKAAIVFLVTTLLRSLTDDDCREIVALVNASAGEKNGETAQPPRPVERIGEP